MYCILKMQIFQKMVNRNDFYKVYIFVEKKIVEQVDYLGKHIQGVVNGATCSTSQYTKIFELIG